MLDLAAAWMRSVAFPELGALGYSQRSNDSLGAQAGG